MKSIFFYSFAFLSLLFLFGCKQNDAIEKTKISAVANSVKYANGLELYHYKGYTVMKVTKPWPEASNGFTYILKEKDGIVPDSLKQYPIISVPIRSIVVTSTTHIPALVNRSAAGGPLHYGLHVILVLSALMLWTPVCGPAREWRMTYGGMMPYLFATSLIPTIPAGWLTFAEGSVYNHYDTPVRVWGLSVLSDQQLAGGIMKLGGSVFMWCIIIVIFFKRFMKNFFSNQSYASSSEIPDAEIVGTDPPLMYSDVESAFQRVRPATEGETTSDS